MGLINRQNKRALEPRRNAINFRLSRRGARGSQLAEFGPALALLVGIVLLPLLDLVVLPIKWGLARNLVAEYSRELAMCESFSQSQNRLEAEPSLVQKLKNLGGVDVRNVDLHLKISRAGADAAQCIVVRSPGEFPQEMLPGKDGDSFLYSLELNVDSLISPAVLMPFFGQSIPGLSAPVPLQISASHEWENLGRDPASKKFYIAQ